MFAFDFYLFFHDHFRLEQTMKGFSSLIYNLSDKFMYFCKILLYRLLRTFISMFVSRASDITLNSGFHLSVTFYLFTLELLFFLYVYPTTFYQCSQQVNNFVSIYYLSLFLELLYYYA